jgi:membrane protein
MHRSAGGLSHDVKGHRIGPLVKKTAREVMDDNVLGLGAQTAYYFFFSLFPIFLFLAPMLSLVGRQARDVRFLLEKVHGAVPEEAYAWWSTSSSLWCSRRTRRAGVDRRAPGALVGLQRLSALMDALNTAYDLRTTSRPYWKKKLIAIGCLLGVGGLFMAATVVMLAGGDIVDAVAEPLASAPPASGRGPSRSTRSRSAARRERVGGLLLPPRHQAAQDPRAGRRAGGHGALAAS